MQPDHELRARFAEMRESDGARVPGLAGLVARTPIAQRATNARRFVVAIAAVTVVIGGGVLARRAAVDAPDESTARWQSPTTSLVPNSGQSVLAPAPLLSSVLDGATTSTLWKKGD
jgi:hypothetical protein